MLFISYSAKDRDIAIASWRGRIAPKSQEPFTSTRTSPSIRNAANLPGPRQSSAATLVFTTGGHDIQYRFARKAILEPKTDGAPFNASVDVTNARNDLSTGRPALVLSLTVIACVLPALSGA